MPPFYANSIQVVIYNLQVILNKGDIGHHMYFISMGEVEVLPSKDADPLATLKEGDMFGEVFLIPFELQN